MPCSNLVMRALVTGGAGFIGSAIVDRLVDDGVDVVVLDDLSSGLRDNVHTAAKVVEASVTDLEAVGDAMAGCDVVFHQAAHRAVLRSVEHPVETNRANVEGTLNVLTAARDAGVKRVVCASSSSVYGPDAPLPTPELAATRPCSPYAVSKLAGEHYCRVFWELYGVETVSLRYFNVYGPRQCADGLYPAVIPLFIDALKRGHSPIVHGDGRQSRDFTYVDDVAMANLKAAVAPTEDCAGRAFNIAGGGAFSLLDVLQVLGELLEVNVAPTFERSRPGDVRHTRAVTSNAVRYLSHQAECSFREGLRRTIAWHGVAR